MAQVSISQAQASNLRQKGASYKNRLYYDSTRGKISGSTQSPYGSHQNTYDYIVTQVRKSRKL